jgi:hypothetical protein
MRAVIALLTFSVSVARPAAAQIPADREAVRAAVLDYVEGFYEGDTVRLVRSVWPEVRKYGYWRSKPDAPYAGEAMPFPDFMSYANRIKSGASKTPAGAPKDIPCSRCRIRPPAPSLPPGGGPITSSSRRRRAAG